MSYVTPRLLILDDLYGRETGVGVNRERTHLCKRYGLNDGSNGTERIHVTRQVRFGSPIASFNRAQKPINAHVGDVVTNDLEGAIECVRRGWYGWNQLNSPWAMVLLDLCFYTGLVTEDSHRKTSGMPEGSAKDEYPGNYFGLTLLDAIKREFPQLPVIIFSSKPREEVSLEFSSRGASGFIARDDPHGPQLLHDALWTHGLLPDPDGEIIAESLAMRLALRDARRASMFQDNILIRGERGSGKQVIARYINRLSSGRNDIDRTNNRAFVTVNSAGISSSLASAELFGIERHANGQPEKIGIIDLAQNGDLFLDEVGDMLPKIQAAMLPVLENKSFTRMGGSRPIEIKVRFLSATNADPIELRPEFLDRLQVGGAIKMPPLRERIEDIVPLADLFISEAECLQTQTHQNIRTMSSETKKLLQEYSWPGNVRELRNVIFDAVRRNPDLDFVLPNQLHISTQPISITSPQASLGNSGNSLKLQIGLSEVLSVLEKGIFPPEKVGIWAGQLEEVQIAQTRFISRYLLAAIEATKRRTPDRPEGIVQIHPAVKLLTGDSNISASRSADIIKKILSPIEQEITGPLLDAYLIASRLRPRSGRNIKGV